jgi:hypothetical protein
MFVTLKVFKLIGPSNDSRSYARGTYLFPVYLQHTENSKKLFFSAWIYVSCRCVPVLLQHPSSCTVRNPILNIPLLINMWVVAFSFLNVRQYIMCYFYMVVWHYSTKTNLLMHFLLHNNAWRYLLLCTL